MEHGKGSEELSKNMKKALFNSTSTHFSTDSGYPKIEYLVPVPPLIMEIHRIEEKETEVSERNEIKA